jgi:cytochrome P450
MAGELPSASTLEGVRFTAQVLMPTLLRGLFRPRRRATQVATALDVDGRAIGLIGELRRKHGPGPVWVRAGGDQALLLTSVDDVRRVLEGSPEPFAPDPEAKRRGMQHFQPTAVTISRDGAWKERRRFNEAVLDTGKPAHRLARRFATVVAQEATALLAEIDSDGDGYLDWDAFNLCVRRVALRAVLGDDARDDGRVFELLSKLMEEANGLPKERSEHYQPFRKRIEGYVAEPEPESLVGLFAGAPVGPDTDPAGQVPHWLFACGDTLAINAYRALALITTHPEQRARVIAEANEAETTEADDVGTSLTAAGIAGLEYLEACVQDAMRLYPTTPLLSRETEGEVSWNGAVIPAQTQLLISNTFNHRDPERVGFADRFAPEEWLEGGAARDWSFNHFSHGAQGCPGTAIALFVAKSLLARLVTERRLDLTGGPDLDPSEPLPAMLDFFALRFAAEPLP